MDNNDKSLPQFSYEEIPGRDQGVIYCHWPVTFKAYFFIRDLALGKFILLPEHRNDKTARLLEKMKAWFYCNYIKPKADTEVQN
jgi:hypothetical protein